MVDSGYKKFGVYLPVTAECNAQLYDIALPAADRIRAHLEEIKIPAKVFPRAEFGITYVSQRAYDRGRPPLYGTFVSGVAEELRPEQEEPLEIPVGRAWIGRNLGWTPAGVLFPSDAPEARQLTSYGHVIGRLVREAGGNIQVGKAQHLSMVDIVLQRRGQPLRKSRRSALRSIINEEIGHAELTKVILGQFVIGSDMNRPHADSAPGA